MNYVIPEINASAWLFQVLDLFDSTLQAIIGFPILCVFIGLVLFLVILTLFSLLCKTPGK